MTPNQFPRDFSGGVNIAQVWGNLTLSAGGDLVGGDKITYISISAEVVTQRPLVIVSPYRGLDSYNESDKDLFFGRDQLVQRMIAHLTVNNILVIVGASGSGKSSVACAGLIPSLREQMGHRFRSLTLVPDVDPYESLRSSLHHAGFSQAQTRDLHDATVNVAQFLLKLNHERNPWLVFVDQFEEIFTISDESRRSRFISLLEEVASDSGSPIKLVIAMRADFLDRISPFAAFARLIETHIQFVPDLQMDELRLAIEQPAAKHGVVFEAGLVEEIIRDVQGQAGSLPLLQYTLASLWENERQRDGLADRHLNSRAYHDLGGVRGALQKRADAVYGEFGDKMHQKAATEMQEVMRHIFLRLVDIAGVSADDAVWRPVRRRVPATLFASADERRMVERLVAERLLVSSQADMESSVEVAHEALFSSWERLRNWIELGKQVIFAKNRLADDSRRWYGRQQSDAASADEELLTGSRLAQALELRDRGDFDIVGGLAKAELEFLDASIGLRDRRAHEEHERQQRELTNEKLLRETEAARAREAEKRALEAEQHAREQEKSRALLEGRRKRLLLALAVAIAFAVAAIWQYRVAVGESNAARTQASIAESRRMAAQALNQLSSRPFLGVALSVRSIAESERFNATQEGEEALRASLRVSRGRRIFVADTDSGSDVKALDISPDRHLYAIGTRSGVWQIYRDEGGGFRLLRSAHDEADIQALHFTADGNWLFKVSGAVREHGKRLRAIALGSATAQQNAQSPIYGTPRERSLGNHDTVLLPSFDHRRSTLAYVDPVSHRIEVWSLQHFDRATGPISTFPIDGEIIALGLSGDGAHLGAIVSRPLGAPSRPFDFDTRQRRFDLQVWSIASGAVTVVADVFASVPAIYGNPGLFERGQRGLVRISVDGKLVLAGLYIFDQHRAEPQYAADVWSLNGARPQLLQRYTGEYPKEGDPRWTRVSDMDLSPDGKTLFITNDTDVRTWRVMQAAQRLSTVKQLTVASTRRGVTKSLGVIYSSAMSDDARYLAVGDSNGSVCVWDLEATDGPHGTPTIFAESTDPLIGAIRELRFSSDSRLIAAGGDSGSVQVFSLYDRGGSVEPKIVSSPMDEGQWRSFAVAPDESWIAAVSESQRVHFFRPGQWDAPFLSGNANTNLAKVPVVTREAMISSGIPGRPVAVVASPDGQWAACYEVNQYGFNTQLTLFRLVNTPGEFAIALNGIGLDKGDAFERVAFDPFRKTLWIMDKWGHSAVLTLPALDGKPAIPLHPERVASAVTGSVQFQREFIVTEGSYGKSPTIWHRDPETGKPVKAVAQIPEGSIHVDTTNKWAIAVLRQSSDGVSYGDEPHVVQTFRLKDDAIASRTTLGAFVGVPAVALSPNAKWLVVGGQTANAHEYTITLWRMGAFGAPAFTWRLPAEGRIPLSLTFDSTGDRFVAGPSAFAVPNSGPPASSVDALLGVLDTGKPTSQRLKVEIEDYRPSVTTGSNVSRSSPDIDYQFSGDGTWLITESPGNLWHIRGGTASHVMRFGGEYVILSGDSAWMATVGLENTRLWQLVDGSAVDHGALGTRGRVAFLRDKEHILRLENGALLMQTLERSKVLEKASTYVGRNLTWEEWQQEFPGRPYSKTFSEWPAHASVAGAYLDKATAAIRAKHEDVARVAYQQAVRWAIESGNALEANNTCWFGNLNGFANIGLPAADKAVGLYPENGNYRDTRGVARAIGGDLPGALADFEAYVAWAERTGKERSTVERRRRWIGELRRGERPHDFDKFTDN